MSYFKMTDWGFGEENAQLSYRISRFNFLLFLLFGTNESVEMQRSENIYMSLVSCKFSYTAPSSKPIQVTNILLCLRRDKCVKKVVSSRSFQFPFFLQHALRFRWITINTYT